MELLTLIITSFIYYKHPKIPILTYKPYRLISFKNIFISSLILLYSLTINQILNFIMNFLSD